MNNLIGISGKIGSGKDIVGQIIRYLKFSKLYPDHGLTLNQFINNVKLKESNLPKIKKFADKLKDIVCLLIGCTRGQLEDREFKEKELGEEWWYYRGTKNSKYDNIITLNDYSQLTWNIQTYYTLLKLSPRNLLQLLGTECGRNILHPQIWVNALFANYRGETKIKGKSVPSGADGMYMIPKGHGNYSYRTTLYKKYFEYTLDNPKYPKWIITDLRFPNEVKAIKDRGGIVIRVNRNCENDREGLGPCSNDPDLCSCLNPHESETALDNYKDWDYVIDNNGTIEELINKVKQICNG